MKKFSYGSLLSGGHLKRYDAALKYKMLNTSNPVLKFKFAIAKRLDVFYNLDTRLLIF